MLPLKHIPLAALILLFCCLDPATAAEDKKQQLRSALIMDLQRGTILHEHNADTRIPPASLTKIMSLYVALDQISAGRASLDDVVTVSKKAAAQPGAKMHVKTGERVPLAKILQGVAVASGNDAAVALAEHIGGSEQAFVGMMNDKAKELGLTRTLFRNPSGLPATNQLSTARDLLTLSKYYIKNHPEALRYHSIRQITHNGAMTTNKNPLLGVCPGIDGLKTGWIRASGFNLIVTGTRDQGRLLGVLLGAGTPRLLKSEATGLMESAFRKLKAEEVKTYTYR